MSPSAVLQGFHGGGSGAFKPKNMPRERGTPCSTAEIDSTSYVFIRMAITFIRSKVQGTQRFIANTSIMLEMR